MKYTYESIPYSPSKFSIHDAKIDEIICLDESVRFVFSKGFSVISDNEVYESSHGYIELLNCDAGEFTCYIIRRGITPAGAKILGEPISLVELADILRSKGKSIEVFLELYGYEYLYWRGNLLPYRAEGLSDNIIIETSGRFPMTFYWE